MAKATRGYMQTLSMTSVGIEMALCVVIGLFGGQWIDKKAGTAPAFLIVGLLLGCVAAGRAVWAMVQKADRFAKENEARDAADARRARDSNHGTPPTGAP